ncbi:MAG: ATP synthase F1 subunit gamma [Eubacteriales bacterium]|nr:ATP synthase F1 subunit gamma [Eubacteriales bacterium]MDD3350398.1 ATP synthase F1 subunit gamma [Eubacteriales bacterium]
MAENMRDIKRRIKSSTSMEHITKAMKLVSAAKLRKAKSTFDRIQQNFHFVTESIEEIFNNVENVPDRYLQGNRQIKTTAYIIVTSNRGFCGSFNTNVIKEAQAVMKSDPGTPVIVAIGSKGRDFFGKRGYDIRAQYMLPPENISFMDTRNIITKPIIDMYDRGEIDEIILVHTHFVSSLVQKPTNTTLLPLAIKKRDLDTPLLHKQVEYEPSVESVFNYLIPKYTELMVYNALIESATCEHAARRIAMESATDNANEMITDLTLTYNRARQAAITREISEIVGGAEALA